MGYSFTTMSITAIGPPATPPSQIHEFTVPSRWLSRYQAALARQYALGAGVDVEAFDELLSCYNLPTETMPSDIDARFWHMGWGPPQQFYRWANALIVAFSAQIQEPCTHDWHCDGFGSFVASVLKGETAETDLEGNGPCKLRFRMMNDDTANAFVAGTTDDREGWTCGEFSGRPPDHYVVDAPSVFQRNRFRLRRHLVRDSAPRSAGVVRLCLRLHPFIWHGWPTTTPGTPVAARRQPSVQSTVRGPTS